MKWNNYKREERDPSFHSFSVLPNTQKTIISPNTKLDLASILSSQDTLTLT